MTFGHQHGPLPSGDMQLALGLPTHISLPQVELARTAPMGLITTSCAKCQKAQPYPFHALLGAVHS